MHARRLVLIGAMFLSLSACKQDAEGSGTGSNAADASDAGVDSVAAAASEPRNDRLDAPATAQGGAFAREPGFQLPVPVSSAQQVQAPSAALSRQIDVAGVTAVVLEGLEGTGSNVQVRVNPGGVVSLSGEVGNVAQLQHAHYLARAQPGVVEVDYRQLRVRQQ